MKGKLKFIIPIVVLLVLGGVYKFVLAKPAAVAKPKVAGEVYVLPKDFLLNLTDGKFAKLGVGLVFDEGFLAAPAGAAEGAAAPPTGYGVLPQEAVVRDIVTDVVTDSRRQGPDQPQGPRGHQDQDPQAPEGPDRCQGRTRSC